MRRRSTGSRLVSLLLALVAVVASLGWLVYTLRWVDVDCRRDDGPVTCQAVERIGSVEVWSAEAADVTRARSMSGTGGEPAAVMVETEAGAQVQLTSTFLGSDQNDAIAARIHPWLFVERDQDKLNFTQGPSVANAAISGGIALMAGLWALTLVLALVRSWLHPRRPPASRIGVSAFVGCCKFVCLCAPAGSPDPAAAAQPAEQEPQDLVNEPLSFFARFFVETARCAVLGGFHCNRAI